MPSAEMLYAELHSPVVCSHGKRAGVTAKQCCQTPVGGKQLFADRGLSQVLPQPSSLTCFSCWPAGAGM